MSVPRLLRPPLCVFVSLCFSVRVPAYTMKEDIRETIYTPPLIGLGHDYRTLTEKISGIVLTRKSPLEWLALFGLGFIGTMMLMVALATLLVRGIGI